MKPRRLDEWPLGEDEMSPADRERFERELADSPELRQKLNTWQAIELSMHEAPTIGPLPGFAARWRQNLAELSERRRQRQVKWLLGLLFTGAIGALLLIGLDLLSSPAQLGTALIETAVRAGQAIEAGIRYLSILGDGWPALIGALALSAALAWVIVVWAAGMYRYALGQVQNGVR